jgi:hypothetical protein
MKLFEQGYPLPLGRRRYRMGHLDYVKDVEAGDIIVAGGIEKISFIGEATAKPVFLFPGEDNANL